jgi:hypothetical protein
VLLLLDTLLASAVRAQVRLQLVHTLDVIAKDNTQLLLVTLLVSVVKTNIQLPLATKLAKGMGINKLTM